MYVFYVRKFVDYKIRSSLFMSYDSCFVWKLMWVCFNMILVQVGRGNFFKICWEE